MPAVVAPAATVQKGRIPLPAQLIICPWGESRDLAGNPVIVNETTLAELAANQSKYGFEEVALDFSHNTTPKTDAEGNPVPAAEPLPIAAMGRLSAERGKGIIFTPTSWTPEGEQFYCGRHYRDLSPTVGKNSNGEVNFIHSVALTRAGQINGLHAYSAGLPALTNLQTTPTHIMENETTATDYKALLLQKLSLDPSATDEQIVAAMSAAPEVPETTPMSAAAAAAATPQIIDLSARLDQIEKDNLIAEAVRAGKVIPLSAESISGTPKSVLKEIIAATPATVPLSATTPAAVVPATKALSSEEALVAARFGYTAEQIHAANQA